MKNWERTKVSYLNNLFSHMKERVTNKSKSFKNGKRIKSYYGLPICSREEFLKFALKSTKFNNLFREYKNKRGGLRYTPTVDRIDNSKGYVIGNMQFLSLSENSAKDRLRSWIQIKNNKTGTIYRFAKTRTVSKFLGQKGRVNLKHKHFTNLKTRVKYLNLTQIKR